MGLDGVGASKMRNVIQLVRSSDIKQHYTRNYLFHSVSASIINIMHNLKNESLTAVIKNIFINMYI